MSDVSLSIVNQTPVNLALASSTVAVDIVQGSAVALDITNQAAVALDIVNQSPIEFTFSCFDFPAWADSLQVCDSDEIAADPTGNSAEELGVLVGQYYLTAANHNSAPGGIPKKRLI